LAMAKILVADDEVPFAEGVAFVLEERGHTVLRAYDGAAAQAIVLMSTARPTSLPPAVIFLPKPFDIADLVALVDRLLGSPHPAPGHVADHPDI